MRAYLTILLALLWMGLLLPVQMLALRLRWQRVGEAVPQLFHRGIARLLRVRVRPLGTISPVRPTLFVCNHVSWLDIIVLDTLLRGCFIAKHEIAGWPLFGLLAKLQRSVFIERKARRAADQRDAMSVRIEAGDNLILFPEGTSSDGLRILPFKSAFFSLAERRTAAGALTVQPVSIAYTRLNGMPVGRRWMPVFAWVGDLDLAPHLWRFLNSGPSEAVVQFHAPVTIEQFASRKDLAAYCRAAVARGVSDAVAGRLPAAAATPAEAPPFGAPLPAR